MDHPGHVPLRQGAMWHGFTPSRAGRNARQRHVRGFPAPAEFGYCLSTDPATGFGIPAVEPPSWGPEARPHKHNHLTETRVRKAGGFTLCEQTANSDHDMRWIFA